MNYALNKCCVLDTTADLVFNIGHSDNNQNKRISIHLDRMLQDSVLSDTCT